MTKHKVFFAIVGFFFIGGLTSCSKDYNELILGEWLEESEYWSYSGSPNAERNYSSGGSVVNIDGAGLLKFFFFKDNTGMITDSWFISPEENGIDTLPFTYSIDGNGGVITPLNYGDNPNLTTTYLIQDIDKETMVVYEKRVFENQHDPWGDTSAYTKINEIYRHCSKIK